MEHENNSGDSNDKRNEPNNGSVSPITRYNLKRSQRSLFTANSTVTTQFNVSAQPFISTQQKKNHQQHEISPRLINSMPIRNSIGTPMASFIPQSQQQQQQQQHHHQTSQLEIAQNVDSQIWRNPAIVHRPIPNIVNMYQDDVYNTGNLAPPPPYKILYPPYPRRDMNRCVGPVALSNGVIQITLRDGIRIDVTLDQAIRVFNFHSQIIVALSGQNGGSAALIHPNGRVYQIASRVEIMAYDGMQNNNFIRYAKMWYKGISFTSENCALIYLVDTAGTRTTSDSFTDLTTDLTSQVFYQNSKFGPEYVDAALEVIENSNFWTNEDGTDVCEINGYRIIQSPDGLVKITRGSNKYLIRTSPTNGSATISTPFLHCTASLGQTSHLFVRRGERRMHFDGASFVVRNAGHSAGFDEQNLLKVY